MVTIRRFLALLTMHMMVICSLSFPNQYNALAQSILLPERTDENIIVAAYNIQWLGQKQHDLQKLAQVIKHFDVCGIIEVKDEKAVHRLANSLKEETEKDWGYVFGFRTHRPSGTYHEAYAVVWRRDRVELGDGIISNLWDLEEAFRNDPYMISFKRGNFDFSLILVHTRWTDDEEGSRKNEVAMIAEQINWMKAFLSERDLIVSGDFNYSGEDKPMLNMAKAAKLIQLDKNEKSTFKMDFSGYSSSYDHIYVLDKKTPEFIDGQCGILDTTTLIYGNKTKKSMEKSKSELSDHLPVWAVFKVTGDDDD